MLDLPRVPHGFADFGAFLDHFRARVLQDAMTSATVTYWRRRSIVWAKAVPKPTDYTFGPTPQELAEAAERCAAIARACDAHADMLASARPIR